MIRPPADLGEAQALMRDLGYGIQPVPVSGSAWPDPLPRPSGSWWYAGSFGSLDIHFLDTRERNDGEATLRGLTAWNSVRTQALVRVTPEETRLIVGRHGRRISALRLAGNRNADEVMRRLSLLQVRGRESLDPAVLFEQALESDSTGRRFFRRFRDATADISAATARITGASQAACDDHALLIMSRLLFLCFVERKGWLSGDLLFLSRHIEAAAEGREPVHQFLATLFFGSLNTPLAKRHEDARRLGSIPYLNGGLFEPSPFETRYASRLSLPDPVLAGAFRDVFGMFDFSVHEESEDATAIDPEMLGRVFEALMSSSDRSVSGSFYTPPAIVDRIVGKSLIERIARTAEERAMVASSIAGNGMRGRLGSVRTQLLERAATLRILDPACGTGAFLLAALHAMERVLGDLSARERIPPAALRRRIVENQLYGIDRKPEAVRLCELRLWLSIVAAEPDPSNLQPLPNLDRNIVQGDSLISPLELHGMLGAAPEPDAEHASLVKRYRTASGAERNALRSRLAARDQENVLRLIQHALDASRSAPRQRRFGGAVEPRAALATMRKLRAEARRGILPFDWRVYFADAAGGGGFDVVLGNPPWVRRAALDEATREALQRRYTWFAGAEGRSGQGDLWVAFLQRFAEFCNGEGVMGVLVPEKLLSASYAETARRCLRSEQQVLWIERESRDSFEADTFPLAIVAARDATRRKERGVEIEGLEIPLSRLPLPCDPAERWLLVPPLVREAITTMACAGPPLGAEPLLAPRMGLKTGANRLFLREEVVPTEGGEWIVDGVRVPSDGVVRLVRGRDLHPDGWREGTWMLWPPGLVTMERRLLERLCTRLGCPVSRLLALGSAPSLHGRYFTAWKDLALRLNPVVLPSMTTWQGRRVRVVPNQTLYCIAPGSEADACALTAFLRSTPVACFAAAIADPAKDRHRRYFGATIAGIPLPPSLRGASSWQRLGRLGRGASKLTLGEIDEMVASAYGITRRQLRELGLWLSAELHGG